MKERDNGRDKITEGTKFQRERITEGTFSEGTFPKGQKKEGEEKNSSSTQAK